MTDRRGTLWAAILGSGIVFLDSSVLTVALPRIARDLPAHVVGILEGESYVYNGYLLGESAFLILAGWLTDVHGRRRIFTLGLAAFGVSSLLSGVAPSLEWLIVLRLLQGISGALISHRSEEHTSELQSQSNLVCRLLLEKKKQTC